MTTPIIAEFRRLHPDARLTLIVRGKAQSSLMAGSPLIDQILEAPHGRRSLLKFAAGLRSEKIDVAFVATRQGRMIPWALKVLAGIPVIIGDAFRIVPGFPYNFCYKTDPAEHRVDRMLDAFALWSGKAPGEPRFPIPQVPQAIDQAHAVLADVGLDSGRYVILHAGSSGISGGTDKRIPVDVAKRIAADIVDRCPDLSVAFVFGPDEIDFMRNFDNLGTRRVILVDLPLDTTVAVISQAAGFIGADSGLGHLAAALEIPTVTLFGPTIPTETRPYGDKAHSVSRVEKLACQPCWGGPLYGNCPFGVRCMHELPESDIVSAVTRWMDSSR